MRTVIYHKYTDNIISTQGGFVLSNVIMKALAAAAADDSVISITIVSTK